ncbi:MAG: hypothetical protein CSA31_03175 [Desulfobulbus propionicus]|nr:MAG: hypothetical protein CSA31_03175 [Desulfobulbus propionicus]
MAYSWRNTLNPCWIPDFIQLSQTMPLQIRFIEFMPIGESSLWNAETFISSDEIKQRLESFGELIPVERNRIDGPAQVYRLGKNSVGSIGFISPLSHHFCDQCNRLRWPSAGRTTENSYRKLSWADVQDWRLISPSISSFLYLSL